MRKPYFYIIRYKPTGQLYAGCRFGIGCNPDELLQPDGYHTSSNMIRILISRTGLYSFEIVKIKLEEECKMHVHTYEQRWLKDHDCISRQEYFNMNGPWHPSPGSPEFKVLMLKKYGVSHNSEIPEVIEKRKQTNLKKYGSKYHMGSENFKLKTKETLLKHYGVDNPSKSNFIKDKKRDTNLNHSGFEHNMMNNIDQRKKTWLSTLGVDNPSKSRFVKDKKKETWLKNYGVENYAQLPQHKEMVAKLARKARANDPILTCPHCKKIGKGRGVMNRWHFDNCKFNKISF